MSANQQALLGMRGLSAPVNSVAPVLSGSPVKGVSLTCSTGTWSGTPTYSYQWMRNGSTNIGTNSASYTLVAGDVWTTIRCVVTGTNAAGNSSASSNTTPTVLDSGQQIWDTPGTHTWVCPAGVTSVSAVVVGGGANGGGLAYKNNIAVTPGLSYTVEVNASSGWAYFISLGAEYPGVFGPTKVYGDGGGNSGYLNTHGGYGHGAGGYSGNGGANGYVTSSGYGSGGAGNGGGGGGGGTEPSLTGWNAGGGVGLFGQGANGIGGLEFNSAAGVGGGGGSGGITGPAGSLAGGDYGGAPGYYGGYGAFGKSAVRICWPGNYRSFPSTNVGNF